MPKIGMRSRYLHTRNLVVGTLLGSLFTASSAWACGGFFCQQMPMDQSGEKIIFAVDKGRVTCYVQILYKGKAQDFSWILPVPGIPQLHTGSDEVFRRLEPATTPRFTLERKVEGHCK